MAATVFFSSVGHGVPQRILLVGDRLMDSDELATALVEDGYDVTHTPNELQLFECLDAISECKLRAPSAIVLASHLSERAGDRLFAAVGRTGWRIPVVFAGGPGRYRGDVPASQVIFGPVHVSDLRAVVHAVCTSPYLRRA